MALQKVLEGYFFICHLYFSVRSSKCLLEFYFVFKFILFRISVAVILFYIVV